MLDACYGRTISFITKEKIYASNSWVRLSYHEVSWEKRDSQWSSHGWVRTLSTFADCKSATRTSDKLTMIYPESHANLLMKFANTYSRRLFYVEVSVPFIINHHSVYLSVFYHCSVNQAEKLVRNHKYSTLLQCFGRNLFTAHLLTYLEVTQPMWNRKKQQYDIARWSSIRGYQSHATFLLQWWKLWKPTDGAFNKQHSTMLIYAPEFIIASQYS